MVFDTITSEKDGNKWVTSKNVLDAFCNLFPDSRRDAVSMRLLSARRKGLVKFKKIGKQYVYEYQTLTAYYEKLKNARGASRIGQPIKPQSNLPIIQPSTKEVDLKLILTSSTKDILARKTILQKRTLSDLCSTIINNHIDGKIADMDL